VPTVTVATGGAYARLQGEGPPRAETGSIRGVVQGFSRWSRKRLTDLVHQVDRSTSKPLFVTLTYPAAYPTDWQETKRHLHNWLRRLMRRWPGASVIWRLEYQKRGAPHYHVLVFGVPFLPKRWVSRSWFEVVGSGDDKHLAAGTQVVRVRSWRGAAYYCSKYLSKASEGHPSETGRMWGTRGVLPIELVDVVLTWEQFWKVRRVFRGWYERVTGRRAWWCSQRGSGLTAYLPEGEAARVLAWAVAS
jgi:hypothetical protein